MASSFGDSLNTIIVELWLLICANFVLLNIVNCTMMHSLDIIYFTYAAHAQTEYVRIREIAAKLLDIDFTSQCGVNRNKLADYGVSPSTTPTAPLIPKPGFERSAYQTSAKSLHFDQNVNRAHLRTN